MITVRIENVEQVQRQFQNLGQDFGKALAKGINKTAETLIERQRLEMQQKIAGGPTPFTLNAHRLFGATPARPSGLVFVMDKQAEYLAPLVKGEPYTGLAPGKFARLNRYGNIIRKKEGLAGIRGIIRDNEEFIGRVTGVAKRGRFRGQRFSIFARWGRQDKAGPRYRPGLAYGEETGRGVYIVAKWVINDQRELRLRWFEVAEDWVNLKLPKNIKDEVDLAIALYGSRART